MIRLRVLATGLAMFAALLLAPLAQADGDPCSDILIAQKACAPSLTGTTSDLAALESVVQQANAKGMKVRVAVISGPLDMGSVTALWRKPRTYAKFLGGELTFVYKKGLLVTVMPQGFGIFRGTPAQQRSLDRIQTGRSTAQLVKAATTGVERLAAAQGIRVVPHVSSGGSSSSKTIVTAIGGAAILVLVCLIAYIYLRGPKERAGARESR
jgi:hypothetical protein